MREVSVIGLDLAKQLFQLHGVDAHGRVVLRRRPPNVVAVAPAQQARPPGLGGAAPRRALAAPDPPLRLRQWLKARQVGPRQGRPGEALGPRARFSDSGPCRR